MPDDGRRYYRMTAAVLVLAEAACKLRHETSRPGTKLSIAWNDAQTECLVKVDGTDQLWRDANAAWISQCLNIYDRDTHSQAVALVNTVAWAGPVDGGEVIPD